MQHCIDYFFGVLLFENFRTVSYIVDKRVNDVCVRNEIKKQLSAISDFLKHGFINHIYKDQDPVHDSKRALSGKDGISDTTKHSSCASCVRLSGYRDGERCCPSE